MDSKPTVSPAVGRQPVSLTMPENDAYDLYKFLGVVLEQLERPEHDLKDLIVKRGKGAIERSLHELRKQISVQIVP